MIFKAIVVYKPVFKTIQVYKFFKKHHPIVTFCPIWIRKFF